MLKMSLYVTTNNQFKKFHKFFPIAVFCVATIVFVFIVIFNAHNFFLLRITVDHLAVSPGGENEPKLSCVHGRSSEPLTIHCNQGRLGNQMCSLATLFGIAALNNRSIRVLPCNFNQLNSSYKIPFSIVNLSLFQERFPHFVSSTLGARDLCVHPNSNIIKGYGYPCSFSFYHHVREDIRKIFRFRPHIQGYAEKTLRELRPNTQNTTFVGVHVRRTDFLKTIAGTPWLTAFQGREVDMEYFQRATKYYRDKYGSILFVAVSDDRQWCQRHLPQFGIHVTKESPSPAHDMSILSTCNHTIMTYGTFGFWGSYLAGGEVVYFDKFLKPGTEFTRKEYIRQFMYLPEWVGIATKNHW